MRALRLLPLVIAAAACVVGQLAACTGDDPVFGAIPLDDGGAADATGTADTGGGTDGSDGGEAAALDAGPPSCFRAPFGNIVEQTALNPNTGDILSVSFSPDELTVYVATRTTTAGRTDGDIFTATRTPSTTFPALTPYTLLNTTSDEFGATVNASNTVIIFSSPRSPATKTGMFFLKRSVSGQAFTGTPALVSSLESSEDDSLPSFASDGIYFSRGATPLFRIMHAHTTGPGVFDAPVEVTELSKASTNNLGVVVSGDGLVMYFGSDRGGTFDIWTASRTQDTGVFGSLRKLDEPGLNTASTERPGWLSPDGCRLYFLSDRKTGTTRTIWLATRTPL
jgi:hypothetical protein